MGSERRNDLSYRADIDGLRALAVLSVALYHAEIPGFGGGYVGVDIFFVISGFLITRIIAAGAAHGSFSFLDFYERRVRRLLPALFVVAAAVVAFTLLYRSPRDADIFGESVTFFAVFAANAFFYTQLDYFADPVEFYPLLHTWSLAVEEQFYLVWPPLLLALWRWRPARVWAAVAVIVAVSFLASAVAVAYDPQLAFFHTPFRMWQLGLGGLIALAPPRFSGEPARERAAALGLALLLAPVALYDDATPFPGLAAAPPTLGAALVIAAGAGGASGRVGRLLSFGPLVFVGLCSYSFYLWHWPALSAARYLSFEPLALWQAVGTLAAAFLLAALTWRFVERPFRRRGGVVGRKALFAGAAGCVAALLLLGWALQETRGLPGRFPKLAPMFAEDARRYGPAPGECASLRPLLPQALAERIDPASCLAHRAAEGRPVVLLWGDSHAWAIAPGLAEWAKAADATLYVAWSAICPPLFGADRPGPTRFHDCKRHNAAIPELARALGADHVALAAQWSRYAHDLALGPGVETTASALKADGAQVAVIEEAPSYPAHVPTALFRAAATGAPVTLARERATLENSDARSRRDVRRAAQAAGAVSAAPADFLCPGGVCAVAAPDGAPLYADSHHLNRRGARMIGRALGDAAGLGRSVPPPGGAGSER